jgi:hypothetical protein
MTPSQRQGPHPSKSGRTFFLIIVAVLVLLVVAFFVYRPIGMQGGGSSGSAPSRIR